MPKRSSKSDFSQVALAVVEQVIGERLAPPPPSPQKNPAAVALGRLGGLKGGKARAEALTAKRRREIATHAAAQRWAKQQVPSE